MQAQQKGVCDAYRGETRIESECEQGDGFVFLFRRTHCIPADVYMYSRQATHCVAAWTDTLTTPNYRSVTDVFYLPYLTLPYLWRGQAVRLRSHRPEYESGTCPALRPYQFPPMHSQKGYYNCKVTVTLPLVTCRPNILSVQRKLVCILSAFLIWILKSFASSEH